MMLRGSNVSPSILQSPFDVVKKKDEEIFIHRGNVQDQYDRYRKYLDTEMGQVVSALVDPMIAQCDRALSMTSVELGMDVSQTQEYQATIKGEKRVWLRLKLEPERLRKRLEELKDLGVIQDEKKGWAPKEKSSAKNIEPSTSSAV